MYHSNGILRETLSVIEHISKLRHSQWHLVIINFSPMQSLDHVKLTHIHLCVFVLAANSFIYVSLDMTDSVL